MPSQISTPPLVRSHWYSQPLAPMPSRSHQQSPGPLQAQAATWHWVLLLSQAPAPECTHVAVPWRTTQLFPHLPQFAVSVQTSTPSSCTPLQSSSLWLQVASVLDVLTQ